MAADLKTTLFLLSTEFRAAQDNLREHVAVLSSGIDALLDDKLPDEERQSLTAHLPSILSSLVSSEKVSHDRALFVAVNKLFVKIVGMVIRYLPENPEIVGLLCDMFRVERFFDVSRVRDLEQEQFDDAVGEYARVEAEDKMRISVFAAKIVNAFGEGHGFDMLGNILDSATNVALMKTSFRLLASIARPMRKKVLSGILKAYIDSSFKRLLDLRSDQLKTVTRDDISEIVNCLEPVIRFLEWENGERVTEEFCLTFSLKSFQSEMIEKRRSGLEYIDDTVQVNLLRFNSDDDRSYDSWSVMGQRQPRAPRWLTKSWLLTWLIDNRILDGIFDEKNTKEPLIKKSRHVLQFLGMEDRLTSELIDAIWACAMDKYFQDATYEVIIASIKFWRERAIKHLWSKMEKLSKSSYNVDFCEFVFRVLREVQAGRNKNAIDANAVLALFWQAMQDDSGAPIEVMRLSLDKAISTIAEFGGIAARKLDFYPIFAKNIKSDRSASQAIRCLDQVIEQLHAGSNKLTQSELSQTQYSSRHELVHALESNFSLISLIVSELARYKAAVTPALLREIELDGGQTAIMKVLHPVGKLFIHQKCLEYRLDFLFRILHRLGPRNDFDEEAADLIFSQVFHSENNNPPIILSEREMCMNFIRIVIFPVLDRSGEPGISSQVARHIFENWFCNPQRNDYQTMSSSDFFNFLAFFCYINLDQIKITHADQTYHRLNFATRGVDLHGINEIWQLLTRTDADDVFDHVSGVLIMIYTRFTTRVRDRVDDITKLFLLTMSALLQKSTLKLIQDPLNDREARVVNRLVKMLRKFLNQKPVEMLQDERAPASAMADPYAVTPAPTTPNEVAAVRQVVEFTGVKEMEAVLCLQASRWSVEHAISALFDDDRRSQIEREAEKFAAAAKSKPKAEAGPAAITPPKELLVNDQSHFDTLLNLLRLPVIDRNAVWDIVESLPPNRNIEMALRSLAEVKFSELLDVNSVYKMLYTLRIIDSLMLPRDADATPEKVEEAKAWCRKFYHSGGFAFVYSLVKTMGHSAYAQSSAQKSCVVLLLKIVHHFMKGSLKDLAFSPVKKPEKGAPNPLALSQGTAQSLVDQMDFAGFVNVLINILWNIIKESEPKELRTSTATAHGPRSDNFELVNHAMYLMASIIASRPLLLNELYNSKIVVFKDFLVQSVLGIKSKDLRERFSVGWQQLCAEVLSASAETESPSSKVLRILLAEVPFGREPSFDSDDYFDLLTKLFNAHFDQAAAIVDITEFANKLITEIHARKGDTAESESHRDHLLAGELNLLGAIVKYREDIKERVAESLLVDLFNMTVVKSDGAFVAKCLSARTRSASFDLMKALVRGSTHTHDTALKLIAPIAKSLQDQKHEAGVARRDNYVGFLNPRHISCYANSLVQQFYMIPEFRHSLFEISSTQSPRESALSEIQRLFGFLQLSERHHIDPTQLIQHFAKKMNINQQNDASEFFSHVTERLEEELAKTNRKSLLDELFKTTLNREIICGVNKEHVSTGVEENLLLGVEMFKTTNLNQALASLFEGDKIDSYRCDTCKNSVEARRVWSIKTLPPILVVHIKRFAMDFNTMLLEKVTSLFEYPFELNLTEFRSKSSDLTPEQCIYDLVGVVVHSGLKLEAGHYYSFIKERGVSGDSARWWRFDDTTVTEFDVSTLGEETFGGEHTWLPHEERENWQNKNAYMLFYEQRHRPRTLTAEASDARVPPSLSNAIVSDNTQLLRERLSGDRFTLDFVKAILETFTFKPIKTLEVLDETSPVFIAIEMMTSLLLDGKIDKNNVQAYDAWVTALIRHYENHIPACRWFLAILMTTKAKVLTQLLLDSPELHVRLAFKRLVLSVLQALYSVEGPTFPANIDAAVEETRDANGKATGPSHPIPPPASVQPLIASFASVAFADYLICMMEETRPRWQRFHQYWDLLLGIVNLGQPMRQYLATRRLLFWLADFYMGPFSIRWKAVHPNHERVRLGLQGEMHLLLLQEFFEVMTAMVSASHTRATARLLKQAKEAGGSTVALPTTSRYGELVARDEAAEELLLRVDVLSSLIKQAYSVHSNITLCQHLSWEDEERSALVLSVLTTTVKRGSSDRMPVVLPVIEELLAAQDSLKYYRPAVTLSTAGVGLFAVCRDILDGIRHIDRMQMIESVLNFCYAAAQKNPHVARALRMKSTELKLVVNELCATLIKEVEADIDRLERTDDQLKLARLSEVNMRWNAFFDGDSDLKEEAFPEGFDLTKFAVPTLTSRDDE